MNYAECKVELSLRPYINKIWYLEQPVEHKRERILPIPAHHLILNLSSTPYSVVRHGEQTVNWKFSHGHISGFQSRYLVIENPAIIKHFGIELKPYGLAAFTQEPSEAFVDVVRDSESALPGSTKLTTVLRGKLSQEDSFDMVQSFMKSQLRPSYITSSYVQRSQKKLAQGISVATTAESLHISHKHLIDQWRSSCGITPKHYQNVLRLWEVLKWLEQAKKPVPWTQISNRFSFCDQTYFIKSFRKLTGLTPQEYVKLLDKFPSSETAFIALDNKNANVG